MHDLFSALADDVKRCMKCGRCSASCPAAIEMDLPPHRLVSRLQRGDIAALEQAEAPWKCLSCLCCVARCPRDVKPARVMEAARTVFLRKQDGDAPDGSIPAGENIPQQLLVSAYRKYRR